MGCLRGARGVGRRWGRRRSDGDHVGMGCMGMGMHGTGTGTAWNYKECIGWNGMGLILHGLESACFVVALGR
jgi:hypothetical protein